MAKFLDYTTGLPALWTKIKTLTPTKTSDLTNDSGFITSAPSYTIGISNGVVTLTGSDGSTSSFALPIYNGGVS